MAYCVRKFLYKILTLTILLSCTNTGPSDEWVNLFNGTNLDNWIVKINHHEIGDNFGNTFRAEDGMIKIRYDRYSAFNDQFGHLYFERPFSNFHLSLEYQFDGQQKEGAPDYAVLTSGVVFHSQDPHALAKDQNMPISLEMQLLAGLGDGKPRPTGNMCSPGTEIQFNGKQYESHCLSSSSPTYGPNEWITAELIVFEDSLITHLINKDTVLQYSKPTIGADVADGYKPVTWQPGKALKAGFIGLQSDGQPINFRNIKIRELK